MSFLFDTLEEVVDGDMEYVEGGGMGKKVKCGLTAVVDEGVPRVC